MNKSLKVIVAIALFLIVIGVSFLFHIISKYSNNLPDYSQLKNYKPMVSTRIYAEDGSLISEFAKEKRIFVSINNIPEHLKNAFIAAEDSNFYNHPGIDPFAIARTFISNSLNYITGSSGMGGASTITQQVVKNFLLTNERTLERKIKEAILAIKISQKFSKDEILELYLNEIYLGSGAYGVAAAAQAYFNKSINNLEVEELALLATLPKAPSKLDPRKDIVKAKIRRDWVINRMLEERFLDEKEAKIAIEKPIIIQQQLPEEKEIAGFFSDSVKKELTNLYGSDNVFESGIVVHTTLNKKLQDIAISALQAGIEDYDIRHGYRGKITTIKIDEWQKKLSEVVIENLHKESWSKAVILSITNNKAEIGLEDGEKGNINISTLSWAKKHYNVNSIGKTPEKISDVFEVGDVIMVERKSTNSSEFLLRQIPEVNGAILAIDPHNGRVLAMLGGYIDAPNQFNRTTQAMRQPGSTMKTFGYIAALENGLNPASIVIDEEISINQGYGLPPYHPTNYSNDFYGPTTLRQGLEQSRNVTTVRLADQVGLEKVVEVVKRFGVNKDPKAIHSLVLGSTETTVARMATAYAMMVNGGKKINPSIIEKIQDRDGKIIYKRDERNCFECLIKDFKNYKEEDFENLAIPELADTRQEITDSATAYQITSMLEGAVEKGTARKALSIGKIVAGKTGTTNDSIDSWFVGFSPDLVVAIYIGFDTPKTLGKYESGSSIALPIFVDFMKEALKNKASTPFRVPDTIKFVKINRETGRLANLSTPQENIFFEAMKLNDDVESDSNQNNFEEPRVEDEESGIFYEDNSKNLGIY